MFRKYVFSLDHKVIGLQYALTSLFFLLIGFSLACVLLHPHVERPCRCVSGGAAGDGRSQLCGLGHYRMRGFYTIQTQADFEAWLAGQPAGL